MSTVYLISDQGRLNKKGQTLVLKMDEHTTKTIFPFQTDQLVLIGNIEITSPALKLLMKHQINTVFLSKNGRFNGKLVFKMGKNVFLRHKQFKRLEDAEFRLNMARIIVSAKLKNQLNFMQRIKRKRETSGKIEENVNRMKNLLSKIETAENLDSVRGYEGAGANAFFSVFREAIVPDFATFNGRSMNPPQDNVNAVLSFIYTLIFYRVDAAIQMQGMDSSVGYFHRLDYGKQALAFDLMEEYRTPIADTLTASLFNLGILQEDDFREVIFSAENDEYPLNPNLETDKKQTAFQKKKGILLSRNGLRKVITHFEKKLETQLFHPPMEKRLSYKQLIFQQVKHFKRLIMGEELFYKPLILK